MISYDDVEGIEGRFAAGGGVEPAGPPTGVVGSS